MTRLGACVAVVLTGWACAQAAGPDVRAQLLADAAVVQPGQSLMLGVRLVVPPGWHVYWKNPGDSGLPTRVTWTVPAGCTVGALQFPVPQRIADPTSPVPAVMFGYQGEVLLMAKMTVGRDAAVGSALAISAKVDWLCCAEECVPGEAKLELSLPVAAATKGANTDLFATWGARVPVAAADAANVLASWSKAFAPDGQVRVTLNWKQPVRNVEFFADADPAVAIRSVKVHEEGDTSVIEYLPVVLEGQHPASASMAAVVAFELNDGQRRGVSVSIPYSATATGAGAAVPVNP